MAIKTRVSKEIKKQEDIDFLLSLKEEDITTSMIMELFGDFQNHQRFNPYDILRVPPKAYGGTLLDGKEK